MKFTFKEKVQIFMSNNFAFGIVTLMILEKKLDRYLEDEKTKRI